MDQKRIRQNKKFLEKFQGKSNIVTKEGIIGTIDRQSLMKKLNLDNPQKNQESIVKDKAKTQKAENKIKNKINQHSEVQFSGRAKAIKNKRDNLQLVNRRANSRDEGYSRENYSENQAQRKYHQLSIPKQNAPKISKASSHTDLRKKSNTISLPAIKQEVAKTSGRGDDLLKRLMHMDKHAISHLDLLNKIEERYKRQKVKPTNKPLFAQLFNPK